MLYYALVFIIVGPTPHHPYGRCAWRRPLGSWHPPVASRAVV